MPRLRRRVGSEALVVLVLLNEFSSTSELDSP